MLHVRFTQALKPDGGNALSKPQKARLHIGRKGSDLRSHNFVQDFDSPSHSPSSYLNFEIEEMGKSRTQLDREPQL
jgi:hypothetical protein